MEQEEKTFEQLKAEAELVGLSRAVQTPTMKGQKENWEMWFEAHPELDNQTVRLIALSKLVEEAGKRIRLGEAGYYVGVLG